MGYAASIKSSEWWLLIVALAFILPGWFLYYLSRNFNFILTLFVTGGFILVLWIGLLLIDWSLMGWVKRSGAMWGYRRGYMDFVFLIYAVALAYVGAFLAYTLASWFLSLPNPLLAVPTLVIYVFVASSTYYYLILKPYLKVMNAYRNVNYDVREVLLYRDFVEVRDGEGRVTRIPINHINVCLGYYHQGRFGVAVLSYADRRYTLLAYKGVIKELANAFNSLGVTASTCAPNDLPTIG